MRMGQRECRSTRLQVAVEGECAGELVLQLVFTGDHV